MKLPKLQEEMHFLLMGNRPVWFRKHVGGINSAHNQAFQKFENLKNFKSSLKVSLDQQTEQAKRLAFRVHDECDESSNKGNFLELLNWTVEKNDDVRNVVLKNAPKTNQIIAPLMQKELINCCAKETTKAIVEDLGKDYFGILVDESSDVSQKEQMVLCVCYVDKKGMIKEQFLGIVHVGDTTSLIFGQGYDGASNMQGELNGLKTLIMRETQSAHYIHCFAHQLQLTIVVVSKKNKDCGWLFDTLGDLLNVVGSSCRRKDLLKGKQAEKIAKAFENGEIVTGKGLNQKLGLGRPGDTHWGSHYKLILNVIDLYYTIHEVLDLIGNDARNGDDARKTDNRKDQDIVNAMSLVTLTKERLQNMRENEWESFFANLTSFCNKNNIDILNMDVVYTPPGRKKRCRLDTTNIHHFRIEVFLGVIDLQLQELNNRFDEISIELLTCMASLSPLDKFSSFDKQKILRLAELYLDEFTSVDRIALDDQLDNCIVDMRRDDRFWLLKDMGELSMKLVETKKHQVYQQVYLLIKLVLILPVATASVERVFSKMIIVKNKLRNSIGDQFLNDCLVTYIERDVLVQIDDEKKS
ncbi:zinc finger MYM-type protein 1-like [Hibiscus syriacus]|uniref:zinc finger MYM-type protein 1-like n=1 Tax=Hibiscus syriacus TaxID=106335 RepID=UPI0019229B83|nr:zinc finger MYM-type protein 1-like [Hibiscus syriacus]